MSDSNWESVCNLEDIVPNTGVCALIGDKQVAIFRVQTAEDEVFAVSNYDPFSNANVLSRGLVCDLEGKVTVASPLYKQHFDLATGECMEDTEVKLTTYATRVSNNVIEVQHG